MRTWVGAAVVLAAAVGCGTKESSAPGGSGEPARGSSEPKKEDAAARKMEVANHLRQIGLATHGYHDANQSLPVGAFPKDGNKLGLSWRVMILPYVEEGPLLQEFKLDEPWDSDHNKKLIARMPKVFKTDDAAAAEGKTHFRGFGGRGALFVQPRPPGNPTGYARGVGLAQFFDGTSNTILVAELAEPVVWTKPDDLDYDAKTPLPKFGGSVEGGFLAVMADGTVRFIPTDTPEATLRALITRAGDETIARSGEEITFTKSQPTPLGKGATSATRVGTAPSRGK